MLSIYLAFSGSERNFEKTTTSWFSTPKASGLRSHLLVSKKTVSFRIMFPFSPMDAREELPLTESMLALIWSRTSRRTPTIISICPCIFSSSTCASATYCACEFMVACCCASTNCVFSSSAFFSSNRICTVARMASFSLSSFSLSLSWFCVSCSSAFASSTSDCAIVNRESVSERRSSVLRKLFPV